MQIGLLVLAALAIMLAGFAIAFVQMAIRPVIELPRPPRDNERLPGMVYYIRGAESAGQAWRAKHDALLAGQASVTLAETELNQLAGQLLQALREAEAPRAVLPGAVVAALNLRAEPDALTFGLWLEWPQWRPGRRVLYHTTGHFESTAEGPRWVATGAHLGTAPVGAVPVLGDLLQNAVWSALADLELAQTLQAAAGNFTIRIERGQIVAVRD
jgi:hypothetical protein